FGEDNSLLAKKLKAAISAELTPVYCVGETEEQRNKDQTIEVIQNQLIEGLRELSEDKIRKILIAYEPVWAIGTGKTATAEQAQEVHQMIRQWLRGRIQDTGAQAL